MRIVAAVAVSLALASCAPRFGGGAASRPDPNQLSVQAVEECRRLRLAGVLNSYADAARCSNPKIWDAWNNSGYREMDLISLFLAQRLAIAEGIDRGELTEAAATERSAAAFSAMVGEARRRENADRAVLMQAAPYFLPPAAIAPPSTYPNNMNCYQFGGITNCNFR